MGGGVLFFTFADWKYHVFAAAYPIFALTSNPASCVEICLSEFELFRNDYSNIINFYNTCYPGRVLYRGVKTSKVVPNTVRFIIHPRLRAKYVYIGDIDIMILDSSIMEYHTSFMTKYKSDFSNILRADNRLTGLHFMEYDKMYPVSIPKGVDLASVNDEVLLCSLMREKHFRFPPSGISTSERHIHGIHASMYNRPPLSTLTTKDRAADFPSWQIEPEDSGAARYFDIRYSEPVVEFTKCIDDKQIKLRSMIQILDMFAYYKLHEGVRV